MSAREVMARLCACCERGELVVEHASPIAAPPPYRKFFFLQNGAGGCAGQRLYGGVRALFRTELIRVHDWTFRGPFGGERPQGQHRPPRSDL